MNEIAFTTAYAASLPLNTKTSFQIYYLITKSGGLSLNGFDINCSCVCSSCYALYDIFSKYGCLSKNSDGG